MLSISSSHVSFTQMKEWVLTHKKKLWLAHTAFSIGSLFAAHAWLCPPTSTSVIAFSAVNVGVDLVLGAYEIANWMLTPPTSYLRLMTP